MDVSLNESESVVMFPIDSDLHQWNSRRTDGAPRTRSRTRRCESRADWDRSTELAGPPAPMDDSLYATPPNSPRVLRVPDAPMKKQRVCHFSWRCADDMEKIPAFELTL